MAAQIIDASTLQDDLKLSADVVVVGTGAGGAYTAQVLSAAGLDVLMLEAGGYYRAEQFSQNEAVAMPMLYQQSAAQRSADQAILILQGQAVGGTTVVNWTSSFRTPERTLAHWTEAYAHRHSTPQALAPWFSQVEQELNIQPWTAFEPNSNNAALARGCAALGLSYATIRRNVKACANTGLCGVGCPINAKQSMLVTTVPKALASGARLISRVRVRQIVHRESRVQGIVADALDGRSLDSTGRTIQVSARHVVAAAGAIRSPGLLLRSDVPDPSGLLGARTFLHPVSSAVGVMPERVNGYAGAPQSVYSDAFLWPDSQDLGFKLEATPLLPMFTMALLDRSIGAAHADFAKRFPFLHAQVALMRDGFHPQASGGKVRLKDGLESLDYPVTDYLRRGLLQGMRRMIEVQLAAGARYVLPWHAHSKPLRNLAQAERWLAQTPHPDVSLPIGSAHVMGGCLMGPDASRSVVDEFGNHHVLQGLSVIDGSIFPSSIGANPQLSIYAFALRNATTLAAQLS